MKKIIQIEVEIDDSFVEKWNKDFIDYHTTLYKSEEKAIEALKENPIEKAIADWITDFAINEDGIIKCKTKILE